MAAAMPDGQGELILVVDDEEPILELTRKTLERHGYTTLTARDGTEALALFAQWRGKIRAVLTDVSMPVMDGIALVRVLRKMEPGLIVIAASGRGSDGKASELKTLGIHKFLTKPYAAEKLMLALQELLPHQQP
jgi:CheY-like chemotaxis protein